MNRRDVSFIRSHFFEVSRSIDSTVRSFDDVVVKVVAFIAFMSGPGPPRPQNFRKILGLGPSSCVVGPCIQLSK